MGISPEIWGPSTWAFLHLMPFAEEEPLKQERLGYYKQLYTLLTNLLPCERCRQHLRDNLGKLPDILTMKTQKDLFLWTSKLHNYVNESHGKPQLPLEEAYTHWKGIADGKINLKGVPCTSPYWKYATFILFVVILFLSIFLLNKSGRAHRR